MTSAVTEMRRTFCMPCYPTKVQATEMLGWLESDRLLYNAALQERRDSYRLLGKSTTYIDQSKSLTTIRADDPDWAAIPAVVERSALRRLDKAYQAFFRRVKAGKKPGFPRFKGYGRYKSFSFQAALPIRNSHVLIPKLGWMKVHFYRPLKGKTLDVIVKHDAGKWFIYFQQDLGAAPEVTVDAETVADERVVGIDVGLTTLATLSTGEKVPSPRFYREAQALLARRQRVLARKKRGSNNRKAALRLVQKSHLHIKNQRKDHAFKLAKDLVERHDMIVYEDLNIARMTHGNLGKSIYDAGWGMLLTAIACKAEEAGKLAVAVDPNGTSQDCSRCGATVKKELSDRMHECPHCGLVLCRDVNAAINILARGRRVKAEPGLHGRNNSEKRPRAAL